jgi:hypothetical protein
MFSLSSWLFPPFYVDHELFHLTTVISVAGVQLFSVQGDGRYSITNIVRMEGCIGKEAVICIWRVSCGCSIKGFCGPCRGSLGHGIERNDRKAFMEMRVLAMKAPGFMQK